MSYSKQATDDITELLKSFDTSALVIMSNNKTVYTYGNIKKPTVLASCRKSILSMLYGIYKIDLTLTLADLNIDDIGGLLPIEKTATIDNLLNAKSGVYHPASNSGDDTDLAPKRGSIKPGKYHLYNNWDFNVLGTIFEQITQTGIYEAFEKSLAIPLGFLDFDMKLHKKGGDPLKSIHPSYHFFLSTRDMVKLGQLMLNNGLYNKKQIIPKKWVKKTTTLVVPNKDMVNRRKPKPFGYGYLWWIDESVNKKDLYYGSFHASGMRGQFIYIIPKMNMVVAHKVFPPKTKEGWSKPVRVPKNTIIRYAISKSL
jgi:hypothetical protein